jgi:hypothetical protein
VVADLKDSSKTVTGAVDSDGLREMPVFGCSGWGRPRSRKVAEQPLEGAVIGRGLATCGDRGRRVPAVNGSGLSYPLVLDYARNKLSWRFCSRIRGKPDTGLRRHAIARRSSRYRPTPRIASTALAKTYAITPLAAAIAASAPCCGALIAEESDQLNGLRAPCAFRSMDYGSDARCRWRRHRREIVIDVLGLKRVV